MAQLLAAAAVEEEEVVEEVTLTLTLTLTLSLTLNLTLTLTLTRRRASRSFGASSWSRGWPCARVRRRAWASTAGRSCTLRLSWQRRCSVLPRARRWWRRRRQWPPGRANGALTLTLTLALTLTLTLTLTPILTPTLALALTLSRQGGWESSRHKNHPTVNMPFHALSLTS